MSDQDAFPSRAELPVRAHPGLPGLVPRTLLAVAIVLVIGLQTFALFTDGDRLTAANAATATAIETQANLLQQADQAERQLTKLVADLDALGKGGNQPAAALVTALRQRGIQFTPTAASAPAAP